MQIKQVCVEPG